MANIITNTIYQPSMDGHNTNFYKEPNYWIIIHDCFTIVLLTLTKNQILVKINLVLIYNERSPR